MLWPRVRVLSTPCSTPPHLLLCAQANEDKQHRELINVLHNQQLRKIRRSHAHTRRLEQQLNLPHAFRKEGEHAVWGVIGGGGGGGSSPIASKEGFHTTDAKEVMNLRDEAQMGYSDTIFLPCMTNRTLPAPEREEHARLARQLQLQSQSRSQSLTQLGAGGGSEGAFGGGGSAGVGPAHDSSAAPPGRVRTPSFAEPRARTPGYADYVSSVQRLRTPAVPRSRELAHSHSDAQWSTDYMPRYPPKTRGGDGRGNGRSNGRGSAPHLARPQSMAALPSAATRPQASTLPQRTRQEPAEMDHAREERALSRDMRRSEENSVDRDIMGPGSRERRSRRASLEHEHEEVVPSEENYATRPAFA